MNSVRLLNSGLRSTLTKNSKPETSKIMVRYAGGGLQPNLGSGIPFPPGSRQLSQMKNWIPSAAVFGALGFSLMCYFTDWKVTNAYIPFYGGKFKDDE